MRHPDTVSKNTLDLVRVGIGSVRRNLQGIFVGMGLLTTWLAGHGAADPLVIGSRLELMVDDFLVERLSGTAEWRLQHPVPREVVIRHDESWEGNACGYHSIFQDGPLYRMYYKAAVRSATKAVELDAPDRASGKVIVTTTPRFCCYAESDDGIHWRKPVLGLFPYNGSKANNIVIPSGQFAGVNPDGAHPGVFRDENPSAPADARYKALIRSATPMGLLAFKSADGVHWQPMSGQPVITAGMNFDSQNLAFWDQARNEYRAYWRIYPEGITEEEMKKPEGKRLVKYRAIRTATSKDFLHWENQADVVYEDSPIEDLYTNQVKPYARAPHLYVGFPARYLDRGWSDSMRALPDQKVRDEQAKVSSRKATALTEGLLMTSRDGVKFKRWNEAFLRPGIERPGTWNYGQQYIAWHLVQTKAAEPGAPDELSLYATESYGGQGGSALRRYTLRLDGFVSINARSTPGEILTRPFTYDGSQLVLNFSTSAAGGIRVELQDEAGRPLPDFALDDCEVVFGDSIQRTVSWKAGSDVKAHAGKTVRLRFVLQDADLFALRFLP